MLARRHCNRLAKMAGGVKVQVEIKTVSRDIIILLYNYIFYVFAALMGLLNNEINDELQ